MAAKYATRRLLENPYFPIGTGNWSERLALFERNVHRVVNIGDVYHNYHVVHRLSDRNIFLAKADNTRYPIYSRRNEADINGQSQWPLVALKFLERSRIGRNELAIQQYLLQSKKIWGIATMIDSFKILHHRAKEDLEEYKGVEFDVLVLPPLGPSLEHHVFDEGNFPSWREKWNIIKCIVNALAGLHLNDIVHGDLHAGNILFPSPRDRPRDVLIKSLGDVKEVQVIRKDGKFPSQNIPPRVVEPIVLPRASGPPQIIDFSHSFISNTESVYSIDDFGLHGYARPYELIGDQLTTNLPKKVDSWSLGLLIYRISTNGFNVFDAMDDRFLKDQIHNFQNANISALLQNDCAEIEEDPDFIKEISRILRGLLETDVGRRTSVEELAEDVWIKGHGYI